MRPLTIITGILLGSAASIGVGLAVVLLLFSLLIDEYPRLQSELPSLVSSTLIFLALTAVRAISFFALIIEWRWRWAGQALMWASLFAVILHFLPE